MKIVVGKLPPDIGAKLVALGIPEQCRRVIIDIRAQDVVVAYYETFPDGAILNGILDVLLEIKTKREDLNVS